MLQMSPKDFLRLRISDAKLFRPEKNFYVSLISHISEYRFFFLFFGLGKS